MRQVKQSYRPRDMADKLIVALDVPSVEEAIEITKKLQGLVSFYKVGIELQFRGALDLVRRLKADGNRVFLDFKLWDIGRTVEACVSGLAEINIDFLSVHADGPTIKGAVSGRKDRSLNILGVILLSSLTDKNTTESGIADPNQFVAQRITTAFKNGCDGIVISGEYVTLARQIVNRLLVGERRTMDFVIVAPGIRPPGVDWHDQKRVLTPEAAIKSGADYLVVGRPIRYAHDMQEAAKQIIEQMERAVH